MNPCELRSEIAKKHAESVALAREQSNLKLHIIAALTKEPNLTDDEMEQKADSIIHDFDNKRIKLERELELLYARYNEETDNKENR